MTSAVIALAVAVAGAVGGLIYFARASLVRADKIAETAETARAAIDEVAGQLEESDARRVAAETTIKRMEIANAKTGDPILEAAFARALDQLNPASRRIIVDGLASARRVHAHSNGDADYPDRGPVRVPETAGIPFATELP